MSFLQINNANPSEKRPFRLSDIQDIWNGIKSLFKAISGQQFRIISGFDLVSGTYTSGTVWYNGELYEYDSSAYPITPSTARVAFARVSQDNRTLEGGSILPFSYKYVCGGDTLSGSVTFTTFVANIEKYKSYLGNGSVTTDKLADNSITAEKLGFFYTPAIPHNRSDNVTVSEGSTTLITEFVSSTDLYLRAFEINGGATHNIVINMQGTRSLYSTLPLMVINNTSTTVSINLICAPGSDYRSGQTLQTLSIPASSKRVIPLYHVVPALNGSSTIYVAANTAF